MRAMGNRRGCSCDQSIMLSNRWRRPGRQGRWDLAKASRTMDRSTTVGGWTAGEDHLSLLSNCLNISGAPDGSVEYDSILSSDNSQYAL